MVVVVVFVVFIVVVVFVVVVKIIFVTVEVICLRLSVTKSGYQSESSSYT